MSRIAKYDPNGTVKNMVLDIVVRDEVLKPPLVNEIEIVDISNVTNVLKKYLKVDIANKKLVEMNASDKGKIDVYIQGILDQQAEDGKDIEKAKEKIFIATDFTILDKINQIHTWLGKPVISEAKYKQDIKNKYNTL